MLVAILDGGCPACMAQKTLVGVLLHTATEFQLIEGAVSSSWEAGLVEPEVLLARGGPVSSGLLAASLNASSTLAA